MLPQLALFTPILIYVGTMQLHVAFGLCKTSKTHFLVQKVRIAGDEHDAPQTRQGRMCHDRPKHNDDSIALRRMDKGMPFAQ